MGLPLVRPGGAAVLWLAPVDLEQLEKVSEQLAGGPPESRAGLVVVPKIGPTPGVFAPPGVARKRPLA
jgi:hypothetical protein